METVGGVMLFKDSFTNADRDILNSSDIMKGFKKDELQLILKKCRLKKINAGEDIIQEGDAGIGLYIVLSGKVEIYLPQENKLGEKRPTEVKIGKLESGSCFGEYSLIDDRKVSASVKATTDVRICYFSSFDFGEISEENDKIGKILYKNLLDLLVKRLRKTNKELDLVHLQ